MADEGGRAKRAPSKKRKRDDFYSSDDEDDSASSANNTKRAAPVAKRFKSGDFKLLSRDELLELSSAYAFFVWPLSAFLCTFIHFSLISLLLFSTLPCNLRW